MSCPTSRQIHDRGTGRKLFICPTIYKCRCRGKPRSRATVFAHKRAAERMLISSGIEPTRCVLPSPIEYTGKPIVQLAPIPSGISASDSSSFSMDTTGTRPQRAMKLAECATCTPLSLECRCATSPIASLSKPLSAVDIPHRQPPLVSQGDVLSDGYPRPVTRDDSLSDRTTPFSREQSSFLIQEGEEDTLVEISPPGGGANSTTDFSSQEDVADGLQMRTQRVVRTFSSSSTSSAGSSLCLPIAEDQVLSKLDILFRFNSDVVRFWLRHKPKYAAMDDLLILQNAPYKTWKHVRDVLFDSQDVTIDFKHMCAQGHRHLPSQPDGGAEPCPEADCAGHVKEYGFIRLWSRLKARLQSPIHGPKLFEYFHEQMDSHFSTQIDCGARYDDVFSGSVFRDLVEHLGGPSAVRNDIFLVLSGDGAQPFKSTTYDMWPFLCMIANLPPSERFKIENMLPILCVPGPKQPRDLVSFLKPFLDEMAELSKGVRCKLWDGRVEIVRCHLLLLQGDLAALAKLCRLKGYNGVRGCMYCWVRAVQGRHSYFPSFTLTERGRKRSNFNIKSLEMRGTKETETLIEKIEDLRDSDRRGSKQELAHLCKESGINGRSNLFHRSDLIPFRSVPLDYMHLMLINLAGDFVDLLFERDIISKESEKAIDCAIANFGSGVAAETRRPRSLRIRGKFKAEEWRYFVLQSSLILFDDEIPQECLDGWYLFVKLVDLCCRPDLSEADVKLLEETSVKFYKFYENFFYCGDPEKVSVCKMTFHYVLHLADSVRNTGPLLNVSQFPMERFIGDTVHGLNATNLAAESVLQHWKFQQSYFNYKIRKSIVELLPPQLPKESLCASSNLPDFSEVLLCHPSRTSSVTELGRLFKIDMMNLLVHFYSERLGVSSTAAEHMISEQKRVTTWDRMAFKSQFRDESRVIHIGSAAANVNSAARRRNYYVAGEFVCEGDESDAGRNGMMWVYYGRNQQFFEHKVMHDGVEHTFLLCFIEWVVNELQRGRQDQVFSRKRRDDKKLFADRRVEGVDVLQRHISVVEKRVGRGAQSRWRTYFADPELRQGELMSGTKGKRLQGFQKWSTKRK